ncbi:MAG TPA: hypothetical protein VMM13_11575, partial [Euzebya sp.]|nr:hypothetical protein [Euzebya sp.]
MHIAAWDEVFIRCRRQSVNALIIDVPSWQQWWPGTSVDTDPHTGVHHLRMRSSVPWPRSQRLTVTVDRIRPRDKGLE